MLRQIINLNNLLWTKVNLFILPFLQNMLELLSNLLIRTDLIQLPLFLLDILFPVHPVCTLAHLLNCLLVHSCKPVSKDSDYFNLQFWRIYIEEMCYVKMTNMWATYLHHQSGFGTWEKFFSWNHIQPHTCLPKRLGYNVRLQNFPFLLQSRTRHLSAWHFRPRKINCY